MGNFGTGRRDGEYLSDVTDDPAFFCGYSGPKPLQFMVTTAGLLSKRLASGMLVGGLG